MEEIVESGVAGLLEGIIVVIGWLIGLPALIYIIGRFFLGRKE